MADIGRMFGVHFLVLYCVLFSSFSHIQAVQEFYGTCELTIDLLNNNNIESGILIMTMPGDFNKYQDPTREIHCDIVLTFSHGKNLMIELYYLDIIPLSSDVRACTTGLEIFDRANRNYYGGRVCMEAWEWEEQHRASKQEKKIVENSPLTFRLVSSGPYKGNGFKVHFNLFRPYWPCYTREFKCEQVQRCVSDDLTCDGWNDCGDDSDEREEAGCDMLTASEICAIIIGILLLIVSVVITVLFILTYHRLSNEYGRIHLESKIPITASESRLSMEPSLSYQKRYNSQESMGKVSRSTVPTMIRRDSDDSIRKLDLEKADRYSRSQTPDNLSERSYRSNPRRPRPQSAVADEPFRKGGLNSSDRVRGRMSSQTSLNKEKDEMGPGGDNSVRGSVERSGSRDRLSDRDRPTPDRERDRNGRYDRDRYSDEEDDRYDDRRRRRRSRERSRDRYYRNGDRFSDEDSDYERERDRRRRSRRRSYDSYSDESDYEYERERERRRRSRDRYRDRYDDRDDSDRERDPDRPARRPDSRERDRRPSSRERDRRPDSRERRRYRDDEDRGRRSPVDDDDDRPSRDRRRSAERRKDPYDDDFDRSKRERRRSNERRRDPFEDEPKKEPPQTNSIPDKEQLNGVPPIRFEDRHPKVEPYQSKGREDSDSSLPPPPTGKEVNQMELQRRRPPSSEIDDRVRKRSTDDRRERYSRNRWTPKAKNQDSPPPEYEDIGPRSAFVEVGYKEETV